MIISLDFLRQVGLRKHHYKQSLWRWWNASWAISNPERWCCESAALNMPANLEDSAVATELEKVSFHSNPKERQCQRMFKPPHNCTHSSCETKKAMTPHSSTPVWKIPWMEEPGRLQSMGSLTVRHKWVTSLSLFTFMHWRRKCQTTPLLLPGESQGRESLVGCHFWDRTESDTTEVT